MEGDELPADRRRSQTCADKRFAKLPVRSSNTASPSVVDFLEVNAELPYTTVVEGLEEFLYQSELQPRGNSFTRRLSPVNAASRVKENEIQSETFR